jgi:hypothetical protein
MYVQFVNAHFVYVRFCPVLPGDEAEIAEGDPQQGILMAAMRASEAVMRQRMKIKGARIPLTDVVVAQDGQGASVGLRGSSSFGYSLVMFIYFCT